MRNLKKFLALVLAMMMALSLMVTANAQNAKKEYQDVADAEFTEAIDVLTGMGVFKGSDGDFRPTETITRAEAAAVLYRLVTGDVDDKRVELYAPQAYQFSDVTPGAWYAGYVGFAVDAGYVKGYNGEFMPSKKVTGYEMLAMLLRAVGYGKNGEFTGDAWRINVGATAQSLDILDTIESTHYGNTLAHDSAREVVAELAFVTAKDVPTVTWTMLGGYNQYKSLLADADEKNLNPTLGEREFGLTSNVGIVVGNQATGEDNTLVGLKLADVDKSTGYEYPEDVLVAAEGDTPAIKAEALRLDIKTSLDLFGHKVTAWHNGDGRAYAVIDEATVKTVFAAQAGAAADADDEDTVATIEWTAEAENSLVAAAKDAGFKTDAPGYTSDRFSRIAPTVTDADDAAEGDEEEGGDEEATPAAVAQSKVGMYRLIDNDGDKVVDVVISLNQEVAQITQRNSTAKDGEYIYIGTGGSQFGDKLSGKPGKLLDSKLAPGSDKTRGHVVLVNEIKGTKEAEPTPADKLYETKELKPAFTGTVSTFQYKDETTDIIKVTLTNNDSYELSGITGSNAPYGTDTGKEHLVDEALGKLDGVSAGKTYTFYTDELGRFIGVSTTNDYKFLYTTFADYEIGTTGTGTISYYAYGVDWNGTIVSTNNEIKSITLPINVAEADAEETTVEFKDWSEAKANFPEGEYVLADGYNILPVAMKDQGAIVGNRIKSGANTRFVLNGEGHLSWFPEDCAEYGQRVSEEDGASITWTISAQNAKDGFVRVKNWNGVTEDEDAEDGAEDAAESAMVDYLLTNETKFYVVSGTGTGTLSVKPYDGLTGLLDGHSTAEISYTKGKNNIYFLTDQTQYGNVNTEKNNTITTVIMSDGSLFRYSTENLYFAAPGNAATGVRLAGTGENIQQFQLYNNGKPAYYWIDMDKSDVVPVASDDDDADPVVVKIGASDVDTSGETVAPYDDDYEGEYDGDFYTLAQIDTKSGQPIYKASLVTDKGNNLVGKTYNYITVNNVQTADIGSKVYKVGGAVVAEVYGKNDEFASTGIDTVEKLNHAISMGLAGASGDLYNVTVAIVYNGVDVSCIYVTNIVDNDAPAEEGEGG